MDQIPQSVDILSLKTMDTVYAIFTPTGLRTLRLGEVADVVLMVKFPVSSEARWVSGQTIFVNGAYMAR